MHEDTHIYMYIQWRNDLPNSSKQNSKHKFSTRKYLTLDDAAENEEQTEC